VREEKGGLVSNREKNIIEKKERKGRKKKREGERVSRTGFKVKWQDGINADTKKVFLLHQKLPQSFPL